MKRLYAGTDIALIGIWDSKSKENLLPEISTSKTAEVIEKASAEGSLFYVDTFADGGGFIDIYVDEEIPESAKKSAKVIEGDFRISIPSGKLVLGGIEEYMEPSLAGEADNSLPLPAGDYFLKCYQCDEEDELGNKSSERALRNLLGERDVDFYDNVNLYGCLTGVGLFVFSLVIALFFIRWYFALSLPVLVSLIYFHLLDWSVKRSKRYKKLDNTIPQYRLEHEWPTFIFELRK